MVLLLQVVADIVNTYYAHSESSENTRLREKDVVSGSPDDSAQGRGVDVSRLEAFVMESEPLKELKRKLEFLGTTPIWRDHSSRSVFWRAVTCIQNAADRWRRRQSAGISPDSTAGQIQWRCGTGQQPDRPTSKRHSFVLLCIPFMRWGTKAHQPDVCAVRSDQAFFRLLRMSHVAYRTQHPWSWLKRLVNISQPPFPPISADFDHEPAETEPLIGANLTMHLFENPEHADIFPVLFKRIPGKTRERLEACPVRGSSVGWGVQYVEALNVLYVFLFGCLGFLVCLGISAAWTVVKHDIQGGYICKATGAPA
ncbi:uncharacterized protein GLRG_02580 [Colletotrichum graminicola M1.001]|uniref:Uncharacterized protein n=1 Tax=Colletotrichum graminicola (strain M1.001 / M2 / FGSC 10212) TaxID=645133 RepID=E3Q7C2_COLGM|nr:uncharacterized protein GLRG_02580 [Colletotrichum graminicola M1.001]EFQ26760.1 hypothetical protein GLRG_02580 [Colletotrichum graminicola M1.001]